MENQRMEKFKNIFRAMDKGWLFRHYVYAFGFIILSLMLGNAFSNVIIGTDNNLSFILSVCDVYL